MSLASASLSAFLLAVPLLGASLRTEDAQLEPPNAPGFAYRITGQVVAADGQWVAVSSYSPGDLTSMQGVVLLYRLTTGGVVHWQTIRIPSTLLGQGRCLALDGDTLVVGTPVWGLPRRSLGRVHTFEWDGLRWQPGQILEADGLASSESPFFGHAVDISGDVLVVSARGADHPFRNAGELRIYERIQGSWELVKRFRGRPATRDGGGGLGTAVAVHGDTVVTNARGHYDHVLVYERRNGEWSATQSVQAPTRPSSFGISLDLFDDTLVVGDTQGALGNPRLGYAHVYERASTGEWIGVQRLQASDGYANADYGDEFGTSVSIHGDSILVGAVNGRAYGNHFGAGYLFKRRAGGWDPTEDEKLIPSDQPPGWGQFARSVSLAADTFVIGDDSAFSGGIRTGKAFLYRR